MGILFGVGKGKVKACTRQADELLRHLSFDEQVQGSRQISGTDVLDPRAPVITGMLIDKWKKSPDTGEQLCVLRCGQRAMYLSSGRNHAFGLLPEEISEIGVRGDGGLQIAYRHGDRLAWVLYRPEGFDETTIRELRSWWKRGIEIERGQNNERPEDDSEVSEFVRVGRQLAAQDSGALKAASEAVTTWLQLFPGAGDRCNESDGGSTSQARVLLEGFAAASAVRGAVDAGDSDPEGIFNEQIEIAKEQAEQGITREWVAGFMHVRCIAAGLMLGLLGHKDDCIEFGRLYSSLVPEEE